MSKPKTHAKRPVGETPGPLCSAKIADPEFSNTPTCLRCRAVLERERVTRATRARAFATVHGPRINPRNRHTSSNPHVFTNTGSPVRVRQTVAVLTRNEVRSRLSRRQQLDIVSRRLNEQPSRQLHVRVSSPSTGE